MKTAFALAASIALLFVCCAPAEAQLFARHRAPADVITLRDVIRVNYYMSHLEAMRGIEANTAEIVNAIDRNTEVHQANAATFHSILREQLLGEVLLRLRERQQAPPSNGNPPQETMMMIPYQQPQASTLPGPVSYTFLRRPVR